MRSTPTPVAGSIPNRTTPLVAVWSPASCSPRQVPFRTSGWTLPICIIVPKGVGYGIGSDWRAIGGEGLGVTETQDWVFQAASGEHLEMHITFERGVSNRG